MLKQLIFAFFALTVLTPLPALSQTTVSPYCASSEYRQFDFWVGNWEAFDKDGKLLGHQLVEKVEQGCVIQEWWRGNGEANGAGTSLSIYDRKRKLWNHTWTSTRGTFLPIDGAMVGNSMVMTGYHTNADGVRELHRTQWMPTANGVRHLWDLSVDGGVTFGRSFTKRGCEKRINHCRSDKRLLPSAS